MFTITDSPMLCLDATITGMAFDLTLDLAVSRPIVGF
jgi:hypothetical protein